MEKNAENLILSFWISFCSENSEIVEIDDLPVIAEIKTRDDAGFSVLIFKAVMRALNAGIDDRPRDFFAIDLKKPAGRIRLYRRNGFVDRQVGLPIERNLIDQRAVPAPGPGLPINNSQEQLDQQFLDRTVFFFYCSRKPGRRFIVVWPYFQFGGVGPKINASERGIAVERRWHCDRS